MRRVQVAPGSGSQPIQTALVKLKDVRNRHVEHSAQLHGPRFIASAGQVVRLTPLRPGRRARNPRERRDEGPRNYRPACPRLALLLSRRGERGRRGRCHPSPNCTHTASLPLEGGVNRTETPAALETAAEMTRDGAPEHNREIASVKRSQPQSRVEVGLYSSMSRGNDPGWRK